MRAVAADLINGEGGHRAAAVEIAAWAGEVGAPVTEVGPSVMEEGALGTLPGTPTLLALATEAVSAAGDPDGVLSLQQQLLEVLLESGGCELPAQV